MVLGSSPSGPTSLKYMDSPVQILLDAARAHRILRNVEQRRIQFQKQIEATQDKLSRAAERHSQAQIAYDEKQEQLQSLERQHAALERQHAQLTGALNSGKVGDYAQGLAQQKQLGEGISKTEDDILELLDALEGYPKQIADFEEHLEHLQSVLAEQEAAASAAEPDLQAKAQVAEEEMNKHVARLPEMEQRRFGAVRQKHPDLITPLIGNACGSCHVGIALKQVSLIIQAYSIYRCSKCGIFVLKPELLQGES